MTHYFPNEDPEIPRGKMAFLGWQRMLRAAMVRMTSPLPRAGIPFKAAYQDIICLN